MTEGFRCSHKFRKLPLLHKTEVLAFASRNGRQTAFNTIGLHLGLRHFRQREQEIFKLALIQAMQEIGLVLGRILRTKEMIQPIIPFSYVSIVSGRQMVAVELQCSLHQESEFHKRVAGDAGRRRPARSISRHKRINNAIRKDVLCIHDIVADIEIGANPPGMFNILQRTAARPFFPHVRRQSDDFITLIHEQGRRGRTVRSAAHSDRYASFLCVVLIF